MVAGTKLSQIVAAGSPPAAGDTFVGVTLAGPVDVRWTPTQVTAGLNLFTSTLQGLVPLSGGGTTNFLRADGTFAAPPSGSGTPGTPVNSVQFNSPLGTFAGTADFLWTTGSGNGLTIGGAVPAGGPTVTPGTGEHEAIGKYAVIDTDVFAPGDPVNMSVQTGKPLTLNIVDYYSGDLSVGHSRNQIATNSGLKHTGVGSAFANNLSLSTAITSDSTGPWSGSGGINMQMFNYGSGAVAYMAGITIDMENPGSAITQMFGIDITVAESFGAGSATTQAGVHIGRNFGASVTNNYGLWVEDQHQSGTSQNFNIRSSGTLSLNAFEGAVYGFAAGNRVRMDGAAAQYAHAAYGGL